MPQKIEISSKTIIFTVGFILMLGIVWLIKDLIFSLFIAFIIAGALRQPVDFLEKKKIPRSVSSIIIKVLPALSSNFNLGVFSNNIPSLANETISLIKTAFSNVVFITSTLFFGFYFLLEKNLAQRLLGNFFDDM